MKRLVRAIGVAIVLGLSLAIPVHAQGPVGHEWKLGETVVVKGGFVATVTGFTTDAKPVFQADFGKPEYMPDLKTKIDTTWQSENNTFTNGMDNNGKRTNLLHAYVQDDFVDIQDDQFGSTSWAPAVSKGKAKVSTKSKPTVLAVDPVNSNYKNNTLEWNLGNGVVRRLRLTEGVAQEYYVISSSQGDKFAVQSNLNTDSNFKGKLGQAAAWDAKGKTVTLTTSNGHDFTFDDKDPNNKSIVYPVTIDPDITFTTSASDAWVSYSYDSYPSPGADLWATMRTSGSGQNLSYSTQYGYVAVNNYHYIGLNPWWQGKIARAALYFDTSALSGYTVASANLKLYGAYNPTQDIGAWTLQLQKGTTTSYPNDPMTVADYDLTHYTGNGGQLASSSMMVGYVTMGLNGTGIGWINTTGATRLVLRELEHDINNVDPASASLAGYPPSNSWMYYAYEQGNGYRPQLVVTYTASSAGIVSAPASNVSKTTARLNGTITTDGGDSGNVTVRWGYGTTSHIAADFNLYTNVTGWAGAYSTGANVYIDVASLTSSQTYYFRVQAQNAAGIVTSTTEQTFTTTATVADVSKFYGTTTNDTISLSWILPSGANKALVRYRADTYPTSTSDGIQVYFGTDATFDYTGLSSGTTYYFSLWGESGGTYSSTPMNLALTTTAADPTGSTAPNTDILPPSFNQQPDATGLSAWAPLTTIFDSFVGAWQIPNNNGYFFGVMFLDVIGAVWLYNKYHSMGSVSIILMLALYVEIQLHLVPGWMIMLPLVSSLGAWSLARMRPMPA